MYILVEGIKYHIQVRGEGKPLVCIHGFSENVSTWDNLKLDGVKLILVDIIGHGETEKPKDEKYYTLEYIIKHLNFIINKLDLKKYSLLGYSMGGRIALAYATKFFKDIDKLILESSSFGECEEIKRIKRREEDVLLANNIIQNGIEWFCEYWRSLNIFNTQKNLSKSVILEIQNRRIKNDKFALANTLNGCGHGVFPCLKDEINNLNIPILYINGEKDLKYKKIGEEFEVLNSNVALKTIENCGHNTHIEKPEEFSKLVQNFMNK